MALVEPLEDLVVDRLEGGDHEQAARPGERRPQLGVAQDVLDLRRAVEGELGEALVHRLHDAQRVAAAVEEVGIAEGDVAGAELDEARDVPHHGVRADDADAPVVDSGHRAVAAPVHAAVARLDVAHEPLVASEREVCVALERR